MSSQAGLRRSCPQSRGPGDPGWEGWRGGLAWCGGLRPKAPGLGPRVLLPQLLARDLRGEMTPPAVDLLWPSLQGSKLGRGVAQLLSLSQVLSAGGPGQVPALPLSFWCRSRKPAGAAWFWAQVQGLQECVDWCVVTEGAASCCRPRSHHAPAFPLCRARVRRACPGEPRGANLAGGRQGQMCGLCLGRRRPQALVTGGTDGRQAPGVALGAGLSAGASDGTPRSSVGDSCGFRCWGQGPYRDLQKWGRLAFPWGGVALPFCPYL